MSMNCYSIVFEIVYSSETKYKTENNYDETTTATTEEPATTTTEEPSTTTTSGELTTSSTSEPGLCIHLKIISNRQKEHTDAFGLSIKNVTV